MEKMEFKMDPMSITDDNEILGIVDDSSIASHDISPHPNDVQFSLKQEDDVVSYRVIQIPDNKLPPLAPKLNSQTTSNNNTVAAQPCQFYLISNDLVSTNVTPKLQTLSGRPVSSVSKRRDDKRRATHNEVERRRRDKINHWIMKLATIIPEDTPAQQPIAAALPTGKPVSSSESQSKGGILSKACEYIPMLQDNIHSLNECLKDFEKINLENQKLRETNARLHMENDRLRQLLKKQGIDIDFDEATS